MENIQKKARNSARRDLLIILAIVPGIFLIAGSFDLFETWHRWIEAHENWELDELPIVFSVASFAFGWFAFRRWHDSSRELQERVRSNERLKQEISMREQLQQEVEARVEQLESAKARIESQRAEVAGLADDLVVARDRAEAANRTKTEFLANMSHELRTPLNAVLGFSEIIKDETLGPVGSPQYRGYAKDIHTSGRHLLSLINDILDISKVESGAAEFCEDDLAVPDIADAALRLVRLSAKKAGIELEVDIGDDLPLLRADERKLKQILVNLLSNSVKFTKAGGNVTLKAWCRPDSGFVFQVIDTGIGIALEDLPKAMSQFGQVDSALNRQHEGTGLGLPLAKAFAEMHGGSLDLQSQVGVGTVVSVRMPAERIVGQPCVPRTLATAETG